MKKAIAMTINNLVFVFIFQGYSQSWVQKQSTIGAYRSGAVSWVINNKLYLVAGAPGQNLQEYDPVANSWTVKAPVPWTGYRYLGVGFVINGNGYVCTGTDGSGNYFNDLWKYDPVANSWSPKASCLGPPRVLGFGFGIGDNGYVGLGGDAFVFFNDVYEYNSIADSWTAKNNFPGGYRAHVIGTSIGNFGYAGAGVEVDLSGNFIDHSDFFKYDPAFDSWTQVLDIPGPARLSATSFSSNDMVFAGLGRDNQLPNIGSNFTDLYKYNPLTNSWDTLTNFISARSEVSGAALIGKIYIATGRNLTTAFSDLWALDDITGLSENALTNSLLIYPNPANDALTFFISKPTNNSSIEIYSSTGTLVRSQTNLNRFNTIELYNLPNGLYLVKVIGNNNIITAQKIIKQ